MVDAHNNLAYGLVTVAPSPASSGTTLSIAQADAAAFSDPASGEYNGVVWPTGSMPTKLNAEIVRITAKAAPSGGNVQFTITRTQEGTSARTILVGDQFIAGFTAKNLTDIETLITSGSNPGHTHTLANGATDVTASATELNYVDGVTSAIQTQLDSKLSTSITAAPAADVTAEGIKTSLTAAESLAFGNVTYVNSSGKMAKGDADAIATSSVIAMALGSISADAAGSFLLFGFVRNDAWNWTVGGLIYLSTTAGDLTQTAPSGTDDVVQILGVATHADRMFFNPQLVQVERV